MICLENNTRREIDGAVLIVVHRRVNRAFLALPLGRPLAETHSVRFEDDFYFAFSPGLDPDVRAVSPDRGDFGPS